MVTLIEGAQTPEGSSMAALQLVHGKIKHEVKEPAGNDWPILQQEGAIVAQGVMPVLEAIEELRRQRVTEKMAH